VALASLAGISFAGGPEVSSKQIITPPAPPESFFRGNEFDIGAFATYVIGTNGGEKGKPLLMMAPLGHSPPAAAPMVGVEAWISLISYPGNI
jgi:hypothetical protein